MEKDKRYKKTGNYILLMKKRVHAGIIHNEALKGENKKLRVMLEAAVGKRSAVMLSLEPDWDEHWRKTWNDVKDLTQQELDARVALGKVISSMSKPPTT